MSLSAKPTGRNLGTNREYEQPSESDPRAAKSPNSGNFKRFARKNNNSYQYQQNLKVHEDWKYRDSFRICITPTSGSQTPKPDRFCDRNKGQYHGYVKPSQLVKNYNSKSQNFVRGSLGATCLERSSHRVGGDCVDSTYSLENSKLLGNAHQTSIASMSGMANARGDKMFFKAGNTNFIKIKRSQTEPEAQTIKEQVSRLQRENMALKANISKLREEFSSLEIQSVNHSEEKTFEKIKKQLSMLRRSLMNEQSNSLNLQKKLNQATGELQNMNRERNWIMGQLTKISRAKLPSEFIDFQSLKQVSLEFKLNEIKSRINESKTEVDKAMQDDLSRYQLLTRKLQEEISKYEISHRVLLKRAEEVDRVKEAHKNCSTEYKRLKEKYSELLSQYHELKKTNINLLKQNSAKSKLLGITSGGSLTSNINKIVSNANLNGIGIVLNSGNGNGKGNEKSTTQLSMISEIGKASIMNTSKTQMGESSLTMELSLDLSQETQNSTMFN